MRIIWWCMIFFIISFPNNNNQSYFISPWDVKINILSGFVLHDGSFLFLSSLKKIWESSRQVDDQKNITHDFSKRKHNHFLIEINNSIVSLFCLHDCWRLLPSFCAPCFCCDDSWDHVWNQPKTCLLLHPKTLFQL